MGQISLLPVLVNKVLLEHSHLPSLWIFYGCFPATLAELSGCDRDYMARKAKNIYHLVLYRKSVPTSVLFCFPIFLPFLSPQLSLWNCLVKEYKNQSKLAKANKISYYRRIDSSWNIWAGLQLDLRKGLKPGIGSLRKLTLSFCSVFFSLED